MYDLDIGEFFVSRDVKFQEKEFPFTTPAAVPDQAHFLYLIQLGLVRLLV